MQISNKIIIIIIIIRNLYSTIMPLGGYRVSNHDANHFTDSQWRIQKFWKRA